MTAEMLVELTRGELSESVHMGHAVVCSDVGEVLEGWGDPKAAVLPRSSSKMIQALPLVETGAADAAGLTSAHLALACASHSGAAIHTGPVSQWLGALGLGEADLRCGPQEPKDIRVVRKLEDAGEAPTQIHNNCSGKHCGFLTLSQHLKAGPEYVEIDHPVQRVIAATWAEVTGAALRGHGIDACSAPNHVTPLSGLARAMAQYATAGARGGARDRAQVRLVEAMMAHPELVAGEGRACTTLMRALGGTGAVKTGAEGVFVAILPARGLGVALKIADGTTRAAEAAIAALLVRLGALEAGVPEALGLLGPISNWRGRVTGETRSPLLPQAANSAAE